MRSQEECVSLTLSSVHLSLLQSESRMFNNGLEDCSSPTEKLARKESLKVTHHSLAGKGSQRGDVLQEKY